MHVACANTAQSNANSGIGNGSFAVGDLEGPKNVMPFNDTDAQAIAYGQSQALTLGENYDWEIVNAGLDMPSFPFIFADIELGNMGWLTSTSGYSNWQTLNRDVVNGYIAQIETMDLPNTSETLEPGIYTGPSVVTSYFPNQSITNIALWEASYYYTQGTLPGSCSFSGFTLLTSPNNFTPQSILGQSVNSACFEFWQWASTNGGHDDWDQTDRTRLTSGGCPA
jgi:hypothetical protein